MTAQTRAIIHPQVHIAPADRELLAALGQQIVAAGFDDDAGEVHVHWHDPEHPDRDPELCAVIDVRPGGDGLLLMIEHPGYPMPVEALYTNPRDLLRDLVEATRR